MAVKFVSEAPIVMPQWLKFLKGQNIGITDRRQLMHYFISAGDKPNATASVIENRFIGADRPFFQVYPKVAEALLKTPLNLKPCDIPKSKVHELPAISVRLPVDSNQSKACGTTWFIISIFSGQPLEILKASGLHPLFNCGENDFIAIYCHDGKHMRLSSVPISQTFDHVDTKIGMDTVNEDQSHSLCRMALGVMMLAADPDYIKPVLLKADEGKTTPIEERIARAKNRGVFGFSIGEDIERSPHFRRPHFAIRWTGKGATVPKLVPVKGAIIGKEIMTTVPTGYEGQSNV